MLERYGQRGRERSEIVSMLRKEFGDTKKNIFQPAFEISQPASLMNSTEIQLLEDQLTASYAFALTILSRRVLFSAN